MRLEQVVQPGCPGAFLEGHEQAAAQSSRELQKCRGLVGWALRPATVRNIATCTDNCNVRKNRNRFVVSIRITTTK